MSSSYVSAHARHYTEQFYDWEMRLRGYDVWPYPVSLEPPYYTLFEYLIDDTPVVDDARKETIFSRIASLFSAQSPQSSTQYYEATRHPHEASIEERYQELWIPDLDLPAGDLCHFHIELPRDVEYGYAQCQQFLSMLRALRDPVSFECIGTATFIALQFVCREDDRGFLYSHLESFFPDAVITQGHDIVSALGLSDQQAFSLVDFGLRHEVIVPQRSHSDRLDPFLGLMAALGACQNDECAMFQVLFTPCKNPWGQAFRESVTGDDGSPLFRDAPGYVAAAREKSQSPLFGVTVRAIGVGENFRDAHRHVQAIGSVLMHYGDEQSNHLIPLTNDDYPDDVHLMDVLERFTHRSGMILNASELVSLVHLPSARVVHKKLLRVRTNTRERPRIVATPTSCLLGTNVHHGVEHEVFLSVEQRLRHAYVVGASGTGKSTLLLHMMKEDLAAGHGLALLDPHGDLSDDVLACIPESRCDDVILIDPSDDDFPIGLNILHAHSDAERTLIASDLPRVFERLSSNWGDQMQAVLANGILAMLAHTDGGTLLTLRRFLIDRHYREKFLTGVQDKEVVYYWQKVFPSLSGKPYAPVLTRLDTFLRSEVIRNMVGQSQSSINYDEVLSQNKILIVKLSHGAIGEENAALLGTLAITAIHQAALRRERLSQDKRDPFFLYIDEFQNFVTPTMEGLLSGARKYGVGLTLAHQELRQLASRDRDVASSVLSNPYTRICFRVGDQDAATLARGFSSFSADDMQSLGIGNAIVRVEQAQYDFTLRTPYATVVADESHLEYMVEQSRKLYATPKDEVAKLLGVFYEEAEQGKAAQTEPKKTTASVQSDERRDSAGDEVHDVLLEDDQPATDRTIDQDQPAQKKAAEKVKQSVPKERPRPKAQDIAPEPGRGGETHKYLQSLIQKLGQERGFRAEIEHKVSGGYVDVALFSEKEKIACEVSVANTSEYEVGNVQKCIAAGFDYVVLVTHDKRKTAKIARELDTVLDNEDRAKVEILHPKEFLLFIDARGAANATKEKTVRGYKVKVNYMATDEKAQKQKRDAIAKLMVESLRRGKGNE